MTADPGAMDQEPQSTGGAIAPLVVLGVLLVLVVSVLVLANRAGDTGLPPQPGEFATPAPLEAFAASSVRQVSEGEITFGEEGFAIPDGATIELLRLAELRCHLRG
ncbi:MAG: hypothetical protein U5Q44_16505 [Dehalococcoidia bacterium]|nr:hypothetical protein [Dehalococcoidia bacterium]